MIMFTVDSDLLYTDGIIIRTDIQTHLDISVTSARVIRGVSVLVEGAIRVILER